MAGQVLALVALLWATWAGLPAGRAEAHPHGNWGSVYRSVDGGRIWEDLNRYDPVQTVYDVSAVRPPRIWEATDQGLRVTDDTGGTWRPAGPPALGAVMTVVAESADDGSVVAGGPAGVFRAEADLATWQRVLPPSAGRPVSLTRSGRNVLLGTTRGWLHSSDDGRTFSPGTGGLESVNGRLVPSAGHATVAGKVVLSHATLGGYSVFGTIDGAYVRRGDGEAAVVPGTESITVWQVLAGPRAETDGLLLGTSRGLLRLDPRQPERMHPEQDIPPFLAVGALKRSTARPDELYIATSIAPYPVEAVPAQQVGGHARLRWIVPGIVAIILLVAAFVLLARRRLRAPTKASAAARVPAGDRA
jgi:hypothetical protein